MSTVFGPKYAKTYDDVYGDKDYRKECDALADIFKKYGDAPVKTILDLGSGTGNHDVILAEKFAVEGVDLSSDMIKRAVKKAKEKGLSIGYHCGDIRTVELGKKFDAALMMFAVLGYQHENKDVLDALGTARKHLRDGGLLVMDLWYGPAVLKLRPSDKNKIIRKKGATILRASSGALDIYRQICTVSIDTWEFNKDKLLSVTSEKHDMRYFFGQELEMFLDCAGFDLVRIGAFPDYWQDATEDTWNVYVIAKARAETGGNRSVKSGRALAKMPPRGRQPTKA